MDAPRKRSPRKHTSVLRLLAVGALFLATVLPWAVPAGVAAQEDAGSHKPAHRPAVTANHGLVTSGNNLASMSGLRMLLNGGNAADAAVATLATIQVVEPMMSGAAGNGFFTIYDRATDRIYSLNGTGAAPLAFSASEVTDDELSRGLKAGVTPGLFGAWIAMLDRFGTMTLEKVLEPAIEYAQGHPIQPSVASTIERQEELLSRYPTTARVFLPGGEAPEPWGMFRQPDLARTFQRLAMAEHEALADGKTRSEALQAAFDLFYKGDIAREMAAFYQQHGGFFTYEDFASYEPIWTEPVHVNYRGYDVYSSASTSRGGLEVTMQLALIEGFDLKSLGHNSPETLHLIAESIKLAKSDIYNYVADPEFTSMPTEGMVSEQYAATRRQLIDRDKAIRYPEHGNPERFASADYRGQTVAPVEGPVFAARSQDGHTTSFSVADPYGNVIAATPTLGSGFGTAVVVGNTGLIFNNGTRIGSTSPYPDHVNYARGGQIPILNNSPIIVMKDGRFQLSLGTPGGETIGQTEFQVLLNLLDFGMGIQEAIEAPRFSIAADPNFYRAGSELTLRMEGRIAPETLHRLEAMGHTIEVAGEWSQGSMQGILMNLETGTMTAGADPRRTQYAVGW